uniref:Acyl-CoA synthetase (AMP-forming)/AMP-acid ligase II n=1 Tax=Candidatus Kentrum sp. MB TaxID=2138164 RepID=A0A451BBN9_9GAMM|nr:MAG: Acyl-CoA synthetase (AMP-forming)/AMP-acid ligase II [Candidatus Kentron sp. MB]VFK35522.1 MAG: Acyl-CoA synthetase (AMP-forming)/AMP-acid ligase II [Candidatus Kentron sp. MB]VFK75716.1 MAG: Acyl-CoA synthetase (AMP-forming)/AMP-acid ligase II [Candidatus Kentron sp. MB]
MTDYNQPTTLVELLRRRAKDQPHKTAYTFLKDGEVEDGSLTYAQLENQARAIAARLQSISAPGERALLLYHAGLDFIAAFFGCLYAGVIAVPTYPPRRNRPDARFTAIALDAQASVVLTTAEVLSELEARLTEIPELRNLHWLATDGPDLDAPLSWQMPDIDGDTLAFLQYTSGSTGTPKGVMVSHGNLAHNLEYIMRGGELGSSDTGLFWLPTYHDMGLVNGVISPVYTGIHNILIAPAAFLQRPSRWLRAISRYRVTYSGGPDFAYDLCVEKIRPEDCDGLDLSHWRCAFNGAEPVRKETLDRFTAKFEPYGFRREYFYPCYGLAEVTVAATGPLVADEPIVFEADEDQLKRHLAVESSKGHGNVKYLVGSGHAWPGMEIVIVDPETSLQCPSGTIGEIWIRGESVAQGYWNRPEETEQTFHACLASASASEEPFLRTGDLGFLKDGELFIAGRRKDLVIIHGQNHYPQDIELTVERALDFVKPNGCAATSVTVDEQERLVMVVEANRELIRHIKAVRRQQGPSSGKRSEQSASVRDALDRKIGSIAAKTREAVVREHEISLYALAFVEPRSFPLTSSGKVQRHACRALFQEKSDKVLFFWHTYDETGEAEDFSHGGATSVLAHVREYDPHLEQIRQRIHDCLAGYLEWRERLVIDRIHYDRSFASLGIGFLGIATIREALEKAFDRELGFDEIHRFDTINKLAAHIGSTNETGGTDLATRVHPTESAIANWLVVRIGELTGRSPEKIDTERPFAHYGLDSIAAVGLSGELGEWLGKPLPATVVYEHPSIGALARHVVRHVVNTQAPAPLQTSKKTPSHPLSHGQRALWFLHQNAPESPAYNTAVAMRILSPINVPVLRAVFEYFIARHPSLRSSFSQHDGQPVQIIHGRRDIYFEEIDVSQDTEEELHRRVRAAYRRPFDLEQDPLFRVSLFSCAPEEHVLLLTLHHIITDGWSVWRLLPKIFTLYSARKFGREAVLPPLRWQYQDFVRWQNELLAGPEGERLWQYWQEQLSGELPVLDLPTDRPRPPVQSNNGASITLALPKMLTQKLRKQAQTSGATLFTVLLAAFQVLLHRYTGQEDILVGSPVTGRSRPEFEGIFGYFINPIVLSARFQGAPTFASFLNQINRTVLERLTHQDYPFPLLVERLQPARDASHSPIFQVMFILQKPRKDDALSTFLLGAGDENTRTNRGGLTLAPFHMAQQEGQFDLTLEMIDTEQSLAGSFKYNTDLFDAGTIQRMVGHFQCLLEGIVAEPGCGSPSYRF